MTDRIEDDASSEKLHGDNGVTGSLTPDESGYIRASFRNIDAVNALWAKQIEKTLADYIEIDARRAVNLAAHDGFPQQGEMIVINTTRRDSNQIAAWYLSALLSKSPIISTKALEAGMVEILQPAEGDPTGQLLQTEEITFEDEADALQALTDFYLENKIDFRHSLRTIVNEAVRDQNRPPILKGIHDARKQPMGGGLNLTAVDGDRTGKLRQIITSPLLQEVKDGCPDRLEAIPAERFFLPLPFHDVQTAPFCFQEYEVSPETLKSNLASGKWDLAGALDGEDANAEELIAQILAGASSQEELSMLRSDGRNPHDPTAMHRMFELWFYMPFAADDSASNQAAEQGGTPTFEWRSLCANFHWPSRRMMVCIDNPWWTKKRPFFPIYTHQRPHSFAGISATENVAPLQNLISQLMHLGLQNKVIRNTCIFPVKQGSPTWNHMHQPNFKLRPAAVIPFRNKDDFMAVPMGSPIESLGDEIGVLLAEDEKMNVVTQFDRGQIPNRTPAQTVQAVENIAKMQPATQLELLRECIAPAVKFFVQGLIQYAPQGITIPFRNPKTSSVIARVINFPMIQVTEQFAFFVTATSDDLTDEALFNQSMMLNKEVIASFNDRAMLMAKGGWSPVPAGPPMPGVPPSPPQMPPAPLVELTTHMILCERRMAARALQYAKVNPDEYLLTEAIIQSTPLALMKSLQLAQAQQPPQQQIEGMVPNGQPQLPAAPPGGVVPGPQGGPPQPPAMGGKPNDAGAAGGAPQGGLPPPA